MAQYFVDFSSDTIGAPPAGWTLYGFSSSELTIIEDTTARGGKALRSYTSTSARRFASYDAAGSAEDAEVLVRFKCGDDKIVFPGVLREQGNDMSTMSAHFVQKSTDILSLRKYVNGAPSDTASISDPLENTIEWAYMRFRVSGSILQVKTWAATEAEPTAWDIEATSTAISGPGRLGAFSYYSSRELLIDSIGFGTNGDTAPDSAGGTPSTEILSIDVETAGVSSSVSATVFSTATSSITVALDSVESALGVDVMTAKRVGIASTCAGATASLSVELSGNTIAQISGQCAGVSSSITLSRSGGRVFEVTSSLSGASLSAVLKSSGSPLRARITILDKVPSSGTVSINNTPATTGTIQIIG